MKTKKITDKNGIDYLLEKPKEGQMCQTKIKGSEGFHGKSKFTNGYFETYEDKGNRMVITRWKVDLWLPINMSSESSITQEEAKEFLERIDKQSKDKQSLADKEKVLSFIRSLTFKEAIPDVNDRELVDVLDYIVDYVKGFKEGVEERINKIK